ncbi:protein-L-isoaspartate O-methyltransferase [Altererythrobacter sp. B11]|uniref:protein-L-isoaspartate O-methyltransferase family protein n=1 Tax=Altererythrobacter sp. B11 TaxID=2060312 RepID=UPI000DC73342|nr:protein-L-isoaspartate O-methyltransferase [Altererythrobacter sp. B11]BBC71475.1 protein-L-isoaspartate O-methyltransferase [Altererythrobacter sp. B11]
MTIVEDRPSSAGNEAARKAMINSQLRPSGVNADVVLQRMGAVAREDFVPVASRGIAYMDRAVPLGGGRYIAAPVVQGLMLQEAAPRLADKVLLVDGGSGYMAELLRPLVGSLEVLTPEEACTKSRKPADITVLIVDGAGEQIPESLARRLAEDGRLVTGIVRNGVTRLARGRKVTGEIALLPLAEIGIPVLPEFAVAKGWSFQ